ncbi:hypothetical protein MTBPR1_260005 [Candidatus Terasakiella magnetica]|uniref:Uncharacterized protein n=1 Tax=Candidatus Terasakiella magnetica TaxID=1867952 RepID=A0A1C3RH56_9PROT|nr:hypothetical protein [Candidatus Terasakiella magnetica]SCA56610.1 hypothetical protein MTBPR1_260005 [Candidatus Terasakiella magnetica]
MVKPPLSRADELALKSKKEEKRFIKNKKDATDERAIKNANLKALRLEQETKDKKAAEKAKKAALKK